jgi:hypothetical protein
MLTLLMHFRTAWSDYFPGTYSNNYNSQLYTGRQTPSDTAVYVSNCLFRSITSGSNGGALSCSSSVQYLLVESSSFFSCKTSGHTGAILFSNTNNGHSVLYKICGNDCCTTSSSNIQFANTLVGSTISYKNYLNYSSTARCVNENSGSYYTLRHHNGKFCCLSVNSSMNKCYCRSGIYCTPSSDSNIVTCSLLYSTFADNIVTQYTCIYFDKTGANYEIESCNILRNTQGSLSSEGTIYTLGTMMIHDSSIIGNNANYIFFQGSSYTITLSNCTVDSTSNNGYLTTQDTVTKSFILALNHMSTQICHAEYDSAGTLTLTSKKQRLYYTCEKFLYQLPQANFISLTSVFIFNFIHPFAFGDSLYTIQRL